jgi:hypothetical protein
VHRAGIRKPPENPLWGGFEGERSSHASRTTDPNIEVPYPGRRNPLIAIRLSYVERGRTPQGLGLVDLGEVQDRIC